MAECLTHTHATSFTNERQIQNIYVRKIILLTVYEIVNVKVQRDLENWISCSRSLKMAPFERPYATFYWSAIVNVALSCTVFELFDIE